MANWQEWMNQLRQLVTLPVSLAGSYVNAFIPVVENLYGLDPYLVLHEAGISPQMLAQPGFRLSLYRTFKLLKLAEEKTGDMHVGLRLGQHVQPRSYEVLGYALMSRSNLRQAIEQLIRFDALIWDVGGTTFHIDGDVGYLGLNPLRVPWVPPQAFELAMSGQVAFGRWITGKTYNPLKVQLRHSQRGDLRVYEEVFGCPVEFNAPRYAVVFPVEYLQLPLRYADAALAQIMIETGQKMLAHYPREANIANEARALIAELLPLGQQDLDSVAARLCMTAQQLSRRLQGAGYRYNDLVEEVRTDLVGHYLNNDELSLTDIAFLLGFSEQSAFSRAFKRWTGQVPTRYRRSQRISAAS